MRGSPQTGQVTTISRVAVTGTVPAPSPLLLLGEDDAPLGSDLPRSRPVPDGRRPTLGRDLEKACPPEPDQAPTGLFPGSDGTNVVALDGEVEAGDVATVTIAGEAGVDAPTTEPIAAPGCV